MVLERGTWHMTPGHPGAGLQPSMRCPRCKAAVHDSAFDFIEPKTTSVVGETALRWGPAAGALPWRTCTRPCGGAVWTASPSTFHFSADKTFQFHSHMPAPSWNAGAAGMV